MTQHSRYTFGDSALAGRRLALVAEVFHDSSRAFLVSALRTGLDVVLDLGCGPGHTTRLVAQVVRPRLTVGLDVSGRFVSQARFTNDGAVSYEVHDVTSVPLPHAPADAIYVRLLLSHVPDPPAMVERWRSQLRLGSGMLLLDEVESIDAPPGVLRDYEDVAVAVVAHGGGPMYPGPSLVPFGGELVEVPVDAADAARMYGMNLAVWRGEAEAAGIATVAHLDHIADGLASMAERPGDAPVCWVMRQVVVTAYDSQSS